MRNIEDDFNEQNISDDICNTSENIVENNEDNIVSFNDEGCSVETDTDVEAVIDNSVAEETSPCDVVTDVDMSNKVNSVEDIVSAQKESVIGQGVYPYTSAQFGSQAGVDENSQNTKEYQKMRDKAAKKAAKKEKKATKKEQKTTREKKGHGIFLKAVAFVLCAIMLGVISAGAFIGTIHITGYDDKLNAVLEAADRQESAVQVSTVVPSGTTSDSIAGTASISSIVENVMPSIVSITSTIVYESQGFGFFFGGGSYETSGAGSGIIVGQNDSELLIVTNYHVIEDATSLVVSFDDGADVNATVKGISEDNDLAVIAVSLSEVEDSTLNAIGIATFGDSDSLKMGDRVIAIGNALGYGQSVTVGYISALSREVTIDNNTMTLLQTDAAINPGNSGGALINESGELIGINSAKYSDTDVEGMGFAIPISSVKELIEELMNKEPMVEVEESQMGYLGITPADVDSSSAYLYNMPEGVYVYSLSEDGPAAKSGIMERDIITKFDGEKITSSSELQEILKYYAGGTTVDVTVQRVVDGQYQEFVISVELGFKSDYQTESNRPATGIN